MGGKSRHGLAYHVRCKSLPAGRVSPKYKGAVDRNTEARRRVAPWIVNASRQIP